MMTYLTEGIAGFIYLAVKLVKELQMNFGFCHLRERILGMMMAL
jgi:hypothetical protein